MNRIGMYLCFIFLCMLAIPAPSFGQVQHLPISAFLDAQPQNSYVIWWEVAPDRWLYFDAFGKRANAFNLDLDMRFQGGVTKSVLPDGRAHVSVILHTWNAVCWGFQGNGAGTLLPAFGYNPSQVYNGIGPASLGDGMMAIEFTMPSPDTPLPPYRLIGNATYPMESVIAVVNCSGELRDASGFPDGTPGNAHTTQRGLFTTGIPSGCPAADCWPAEKVQFKATGK